MSHLLDGILGLAPAWILVVAGLLVFAEDAAFIGFVIPGESAAVLTGVAAALGPLPLVLAVVVIVLAAVVGDSVGYEVGRKVLGPRLLESRLLTAHRHRITRAESVLRRRGGSAVFLGRFTAFLRAMMPALAGVARMPYRRFLVWNAAGGLIWGTGFVLLGYAAGASYRSVERQAGRGLAVALTVIVVLAIVVWRLRSERAGRQ